MVAHYKAIPRAKLSRRKDKTQIGADSLGVDSKERKKTIRAK
jgi:hypothetical protein